MKLCMIGTGYVGLVSGVCFSDLGNDVICVDNDKQKLEILICCPTLPLLLLVLFHNSNRWILVNML